MKHVTEAPLVFLNMKEYDSIAIAGLYQTRIKKLFYLSFVSFNVRMRKAAFKSTVEMCL